MFASRTTLRPADLTVRAAIVALALATGYIHYTLGGLLFTLNADEPHLRRALGVVREVGLGYLRLGQAATELSGGEAQRIKLATELQRVQRGTTLYVLDEPTTGLHAEDVNKLMAQLDGLVESGNTVIVVEHDMRVVSASDYVIDIGPGAGEEGGRVVAAGTPVEVSRSSESRTAPFLAGYMEPHARLEAGVRR